MQPSIEHLPERGRFQAVVEGQTCIAEYRLDAGVMAVTHTELAPQHEGRGIAGALMRALLDHAQAHGLKVLPLCAYARTYMDRHPERAALLA